VVILHVDPERGFGGGETQVLGLVRHLAGAGHEPVVAADPAGALAAAAEALGIPVVACPIRNHADVGAARRLARLMAVRCYDVVHFHTARAHAMSAFLGRAGRTRRVVTRRMDYPLHGGWYARRLYNRTVDAVVAISDGVRAVLIAGGVEPRRIHLIRSGVDVERFAADDQLRDAERARRGLAAGEFVIAVVAALEDRKGHAVLLDAVAMLPDLRLRVLCGGTGSRAEALARRRDALGLGDRVTFLGRVADVPALLAAADAAVLPSLHEGLGVAALEAMAAGRPVVASRVGGLPEALGEGEAGVLVPPGDAAALAAALRGLATTPAEQRALGAGGRRRAGRLFSMDAMARRTVALYRRLSERTDGTIDQAS
jgi:glycosyltransferase involved in cell wall biosynthesis